MGVGCGATNVFELGCETEVRERSNETWLKIDYGQLHIRIKSMWLRRVYFVLLKFLRAKIVAPMRHTQKHCRWPHLSPRRRHACGMAGEPSSKLGRLSWWPLSFRKSSVGTFETCRRALNLSAYRGRPEVVCTRSERRDW